MLFQAVTDVVTVGLEPDLTIILEVHEDICPQLIAQSRHGDRSLRSTRAELFKFVLRAPGRSLVPLPMRLERVAVDERDRSDLGDRARSAMIEQGTQGARGTATLRTPQRHRSQYPSKPLYLRSARRQSDKGFP